MPNDEVGYVIERSHDNWFTVFVGESLPSEDAGESMIAGPFWDVQDALDELHWQHRPDTVRIYSLKDGLGMPLFPEIDAYFKQSLRV